MVCTPHAPWKLSGEMLLDLLMLRCSYINRLRSKGGKGKHETQCCWSLSPLSVPNSCSKFLNMDFITSFAKRRHFLFMWTILSWLITMTGLMLWVSGKLSFSGDYSSPCSNWQGLSQHLAALHAVVLTRLVCIWSYQGSMLAINFFPVEMQEKKKVQLQLSAIEFTKNRRFLSIFTLLAPLCG
jgi:hypothetical protein